MKERMQFYTVPDFIAATSPQLGYGLSLDLDAPFRLYGVGVFPLGGGANAGRLEMRFTRPDGSWMQRNLVPTTSLAAAFSSPQPVTPGYPSPNFFLFSPIFPNLIYKPGSTIDIDIQAIAGGSAPLQCVVVFIGTKLYADGTGVWITDPPRQKLADMIPFLGYSVGCTSAQLAAQGIVRDVPFNVQPDAGFIWQTTVNSDLPEESSSLSFFTPV